MNWADQLQVVDQNERQPRPKSLSHQVQKNAAEPVVQQKHWQDIEVAAEGGDQEAAMAACNPSAWCSPLHCWLHQGRIRSAISGALYLAAARLEEQLHRVGVVAYPKGEMIQ